MKGANTLMMTAPGLTARAYFTSLPQEVVEMIVNHLHGNDKSHLALCCKATLVILCMGHVTVRTDEHKRDKRERERPLLQATRSLTKQPGGVAHLQLSLRDKFAEHDRHTDCQHLIDLSLLLNLRKLTLGRVAISLPALQPVATRLHELHIDNSHLQGSADGFLTKGWTALTSLSLTKSRMDRTILTAALKLPALEDVRICGFMGHQSGQVKLDQLTGSCPQISRLQFQLGSCLQQATGASRQNCGLLNLKRLADLHILGCPLKAKVDLDLPPSLTQLKLGGYSGGGDKSVDFFCALQEAAKCARRGAQLQRLTCECAEAHLQPAQWGASLDEQHRRLGGQLGSLRKLVVSGAQDQLLSALGAVAGAAPSLVSLEIVTLYPLSRVEVSPICSASLERIRVKWGFHHRPQLPPPHVLLTLLPGCARLQEVVVHFPIRPFQGAAVKIRCHCCSQRCIVPMDGCAGIHSDVIVKFLHMPSSEQGGNDYTVLSECHATGPGEASLWGHSVMPGIL